MFNLLTVMLNGTIFVTVFELLTQLLLFIGIFKLIGKWSKLWQEICVNLSLFLILSTSYKLLFTVLGVMFGAIVISIYIKLFLLGLTLCPLINLWVKLPGLLIHHKQAKEAPQPSLKVTPAVPEHDDVKLRLERSLKRLNRCVPTIN